MVWYALYRIASPKRTHRPHSLSTHFRARLSLIIHFYCAPSLKVLFDPADLFVLRKLAVKLLFLLRARFLLPLVALRSRESGAEAGAGAGADATFPLPLSLRLCAESRVQRIGVNRRLAAGLACNTQHQQQKTAAAEAASASSHCSKKVGGLYFITCYQGVYPYNNHLAFWKLWI